MSDTLTITHTWKCDAPGCTTPTSDAEACPFNTVTVVVPGSPTPIRQVNICDTCKITVTVNTIINLNVSE